MVDPMLIPMILTICISGLISILSQIQHSRCSRIESPCCTCIRKVSDEQEGIVPFRNETENQNINNI